MRSPDVVLAGVPKAATSSIYEWLNAHPHTRGSSPKETFYFIEPDNPLCNQASHYMKDGLEGYAKFFSEPCPDDSVVFEATTHYIYSELAAEVLSGLDPTPTIVFSLRRPSQRIYSAFRFTKYRLSRMVEDVSFPEYLDLIRGNSNRRIEDVFESPRDAYGSKKLLDHARYADYLPLWLERFPRERLKFYRFTDVVSDPRAFMKRLSLELGIDPTFYEQYDFEQQNSSYTAHNYRLHRLAKTFAWNLSDSRLKELGKRVYRSLQKLGSNKSASRNEQLLDELSEEFLEHNRRVQQLTGLDLHDWWSPAGG